jgi:putative DNA methylase
MDRLLDLECAGPRYLADAEIAEAVLDGIRYHAAEFGHYDLHAFAVMPNHVHLLITPRVVLPKLMKSLKGFTAKQANLLLGRTGECFWQEESYDHLIRNRREFERIREYIEWNPVRAGLVASPEEYRWSSGWGDPAVARGPGGPPH